ncbi:UDP-N-acetylmuramate dehydrogenase [Paenibacillus turpanensis]|uniref:UDP-N-acetylmuramate dehydrogenase n=1 Tax=Paenibacillus turpanensis TaxID=2689078 RepID=UPI00140A2ED7|nr:UDP-N-acetylmuramate dehydrogenase [Paenibacillus turpanensis]
MQHIITELSEANVGKVAANERLSGHTTWKIGGPADIFVIPGSKEGLQTTIRLLHKHQLPWKVIGRGSNMLVSDKGFRGAIIKLGGGMEGLRFEGTDVIAGGSYSFIKLSVMAGKEGLTGLEWAGGIPGTVGGAVYMNAGALGSDVSRILKSAEVLLETGELVRYEAQDFEFAYRHSVLHGKKGIVTEATFGLAYGDRREIAAAMAAYKDRRLRTQPLQLPSAGSVFRNPEGNYAAKLIEEAGLKGTSIGGAEISTQHANFIVNHGHATAEDVLSLIRLIQRTVYEKFGVQLHPEVLEVGER